MEQKPHLTGTAWTRAELATIFECETSDKDVTWHCQFWPDGPNSNQNITGRRFLSPWFHFHNHRVYCTTIPSLSNPPGTNTRHETADIGLHGQLLNFSSLVHALHYGVPWHHFVTMHYSHTHSTSLTEWWCPHWTLGTVPLGGQDLVLGYQPPQYQNQGTSWGGMVDDGEPPQPCKHASPDPDYKVLLDTTRSSLPHRSRYRITWKEGIT